MPGTRSRSPESLGGTTAGVMLYVENADAVYNKAVSEGAQVETAIADMFWGDRYGRVIDPFGHSWGIATHTEDVAPAEMEKRIKEAMAQQAQRTQSAH
jgi:PhnB protein